MALTATFTANFKSFYDAVDTAEVKLKDLDTEAGKVGTSLQKMAQSFSGTKIVSEATLMVKAIGGVEGIAKLTEKEIARLGVTTNEAVEKLKKLGKDVPKDLQAVADATKGANTQTVNWLGTLGKIGAAVGVAFSVDAVKDFVGSILDLASNIKDLSAEWGVSMRAVQQFTGAAKDAGMEATTVGKAIQHLTLQVAGTDKPYEALLNNIGLTREGLQKLSTEDAFRVVLEKLAGIKDESDRLTNAQALLGEAGKRMAGALGDGFLEAADKQKTWADDQVQRLADAEGHWKRFYNNLVLYSGEFLGDTLAHLGVLSKSWGTFFTFAYKAATDKNAAALFLAQLHTEAALLEQQNKKTAESNTQVTETTNILGGAVLNAALVLQQQKKAEEAAAMATAARKKAIEDATKKEDAYNKAVADSAKKIADLGRAFAGADLVDKANQYLEALEDTIPIQKMTETAQANINKVMADAIDVYVRAGTVIPKALLDTWVATKVASDNVVTFNFHLDELKKRYLDLTQMPKFDPLSVGTSVPLPDAPKEDRMPQLVQDIRKVSTAIGDLGAVVGGTFGDVLTGVADIGWAFDQATVSVGGMKTGLEELTTGKTTQGLANIGASALQLATNFLAATEGAGLLQSTMTGAAMGAAFGWPGVLIGGAYGLARGMQNADMAAGNLAKAQMQVLGKIPMWVDLTRHADAFNKIIDANTMQELQIAWEQFSTEVEASKLREDIIEAAGGVEQLRRAAQLAGVDIEKLLKLNGDPLKEEIANLTEAFAFQQQSMATLQETAEKYGFTLAELGPAMQGAELDKQAQQLFKDWEVLNAAGIETIDISNRMGEAVSQYVHEAKAMGFEIPQAMRPMIEAMIKNGDLLNENGEAIKDLESGGIKFGLTMSEGFTRLIGVVEKLAEAIGRTLGVAIDNVPDVEVQGRVTWDVDDPRAAARNADTAQESQAGPDWESYARGTDGFRNFGAGTPVMLHGWEAVVPMDRSSATVSEPVMAAASAPAGLTVVLEQDGKTSAQWIAPYLAGEVYRLRLA